MMDDEWEGEHVWARTSGTRGFGDRGARGEKVEGLKEADTVVR